MIDRRDFLKNVCAASAACGLPARIWGAAKSLGRPDLVIGVLSDIHIQLPPNEQRRGSLQRFRHALEYFRERGVDGVLVSGDLTNAGLETELAAVARTWFEVFPDGKLPDGRPVANLMHYGDHDVETRFYGDWIKDRFEKAGLAVPRSLSQGENYKVVWEELFREPWSQLRHVKVKGYDFVLSNFTRECASAPRDLESRLRAMNLSPDKQFFFSQHRWIRGTYLADEGMDCLADNGVTHTVLPKFPNAIAFQGHTHYMLTDERNVWIGPFISIGTGALLYQSPGRMRENGTSISWIETDPLRDSQMPCLDAERGHAGMVMSVRGDLVTLERRDFGLDCPLGPDLVFSTDPKIRQMNCDAIRKKVAKVPEFAQSACVKVSEQLGKDRQGRVSNQLVVTFPTVCAGKDRPRAMEYFVRAEKESGELIKEKRVYSPGINLPEAFDSKMSSCVFAKSEIACDGTVRFVVRPANCWGVCGRPIVGK